MFILLDAHDYWPVCFKKNLFYLNKNFCRKRSSFKCIKCLMSTNAISTISYPFLSFLVISEYFLRNESLQFNNVITHSKFMGDIIKKEFKVEPKVINYPYFGKKIVNKRRAIKNQINFKLQWSMTKTTDCSSLFWILKIVICDLFVICDLSFGIFI